LATPLPLTKNPIIKATFPLPQNMRQLGGERQLSPPSPPLWGKGCCFGKGRILGEGRRRRERIQRGIAFGLLEKGVFNYILLLYLTFILLYLIKSEKKNFF